MPARITIQFYNNLAGRYWTNRYFTSDDWTAAGDTMDALVAAHRAILYDNNVITNIRVDDNVEETDNYDTVAVNLPGLRSGGGFALLPLFNVARVDFDVTGGGRPSRKYLRGCLAEGDASFTGLEAAMVTQLNTFGDALIAIGTLVDPQGQAFLDAVPWPFVQMRQLKRGSKKKIIPSSPTPV